MEKDEDSPDRSKDRIGAFFEEAAGLLAGGVVVVLFGGALVIAAVGIFVIVRWML